MTVGLTAVKLGITGFLLPFAFALNTDYISFAFDLQTLLTWLSGLAISYSLAISLQGYVEGKITVIERIAYFGVIVLTITASKLFSVIGIALFLALFGFRKLQAKKAAKAAA